MRFCKHELYIIKERSSCQGGSIYQCDLHGEVVKGTCKDFKSCLACKDYIRTESKVWFTNEVDQVTDYKSDLLRVSQLDFGTPQAEGTGIVLVGGGKWWPGNRIAIEMFRRCGVNYPIEVWHNSIRGEPIDSTFEGVDFRDIAKFPNIIRTGGWESKVWAIAHSKFEKIIFIDADAYTVRPIQHIIDRIDEDQFLFWEDLPGLSELNLKWRNVYPKGIGSNIPTVQGGQLFLNRKKMWRTICIANWMCQHSEYFFKHMYGEQDTWRAALAITGDKFRSLGRPVWNQVAYLYEDPPVIVHRCKDKLFPNHSGVQKNYLPREYEVFDIFRQIMKAWNELQTLLKV